MNKSIKITLNPDYFLRHDKKRSYILSWHSYHNARYNGENGFNAFIHPVHAMILSFFQGNDVNKTIKNVSKTLGLPIELIENFVFPLIENNKNIGVEFAGIMFTFPKMTLIDEKKVKPEHIRNYSYDLFKYSEIDLNTHRQYIPSDITLMLNNICYTDCIYCYADRRNKMQTSLSIKRIKELIDEAKNIQVRSFELAGGEIFLYPKWEEILKYLKKKQLELPYISTKLPISTDIVEKLHNLKLDIIQISLDTLIENNLKTVINVKSNYIDKIKNTIFTLEKYGINIIIHTILTKYNSNIEDIESIFNFLLTVKNINIWRIDLAEHTMYKEKESFNNFKIAESQKIPLLKYFEKIKKQSKFEIEYNLNIETYTLDKINKISNFKNRNLCSGNLSYMYILPDGNVTICEELYWQPNFILGNVSQNSIKEVWNSKKANKLFYLKQENIPKDSYCHTCKEFNECRSYKHVCWKEVIRKYGIEKWYYPDPACPYAPEVPEPNLIS